MLEASTFVTAKDAALLTNVTRAVPALLRTDALPAAANAVAKAAEDVLLNKPSAPYSDTDILELDAEKLTILPMTYSPALKDEVAKVIVWISALDQPPWSSVREADPTTVDVPVVQDHDEDALPTSTSELLLAKLNIPHD